MLALNLGLRKTHLSLIHNNHPIGIFDSGVGGLSIAKSIADLLPNESFIYLADTLNAPYGNLSSDQIKERVNKIAQWFIDQDAKALVIACNTATVNAIDQLRTFINIPVIGVEPAIKPAAQQSQSKKIAIMVTQATANNERFIKLVNSHKHGAKVNIQACPGLVEIVETDKVKSNRCQLLLKQYLAPLLNSDIDTLVLGCTHYPFLSDQIRSIVGNKIRLVETSAPVAKQLQRQLVLHNLTAQPDHIAQFFFFSTDRQTYQEKVFEHLWKNNLTLQHVSI